MQEHIDNEIIVSIKSQIEAIQATYQEEKSVKYELIAAQYMYLKHQLFNDLSYALLEMKLLPIEYSVYLLRQVQQKFEIKIENLFNTQRKKTPALKLIQEFLQQFILNPLFVIQSDTEKRVTDWTANMLTI